MLAKKTTTCTCRRPRDLSSMTMMVAASFMLFFSALPTQYNCEAFHLLPLSIGNQGRRGWRREYRQLPVSRSLQLSMAQEDGYVDPSSLLYAEHEKLLVSRGEFEGTLMSSSKSTTMELPANIVKGGGGGGGFGGGGSSSSSKSGTTSKSKKSLLKTQAKAHAKVLKDQGVVRIDNILPPKVADSLREQVYALRQESETLIDEGRLSPKDCFADVLLTHNRRDMTLPIGPTWIAQALQKILLESPIGLTLESILGPKALLREWSCLMSDPGSQRQVVHPDTPWQGQEPVLYTCFVALQDISLDMGPTTWLPKTHTEDMHAKFQDSDESIKNDLLQNQPAVLGTLSKGSCAIFDSRLLHCGGANSSETSRALLYCSFQNPNIINPGNPGSIRPDLIGRWTLEDLTSELELFRKNKASLVQVVEESVS